MSLTKNVAIFYKDLEWGEAIFNKVINEVPVEWINSLKKNKKDGVYELRYGKNDRQSIIFMRKADNNVGRCRRFDDVYIQDTVESCIKEEVLMPLLLQKGCFEFSMEEIRDIL